MKKGIFAGALAMLIAVMFSAGTAWGQEEQGVTAVGAAATAVERADTVKKSSFLQRWFGTKKKKAAETSAGEEEGEETEGARFHVAGSSDSKGFGPKWFMSSDLLKLRPPSLISISEQLSTPPQVTLMFRPEHTPAAKLQIRKIKRTLKDNYFFNQLADPLGSESYHLSVVFCLDCDDSKEHSVNQFYDHFLASMFYSKSVWWDADNDGVEDEIKQFAFPIVSIHADIVLFFNYGTLLGGQQLPSDVTAVFTNIERVTCYPNDIPNFDPNDPATYPYFPAKCGIVQSNIFDGTNWLGWIEEQPGSVIFEERYITPAISLSAPNRIVLPENIELTFMLGDETNDMIDILDTSININCNDINCPCQQGDVECRRNHLKSVCASLLDNLHISEPFFTTVGTDKLGELYKFIADDSFINAIDDVDASWRPDLLAYSKNIAAWFRPFVTPPDDTYDIYRCIGRRSVP